MADSFMDSGISWGSPDYDFDPNSSYSPPSWSDLPEGTFGIAGGFGDPFGPDPTIPNYENIGRDYLNPDIFNDPGTGFGDQYDFGQNADLGLGDYNIGNGATPSSPDYLQQILNGLGGGLSSLGGFLGNNWQDLARLGLGSAGLYGNYRANKDQVDLLRDQFGLQQELGRGNLDLQRELGRGNLDLQNRTLDLQNRENVLNSGIDEMASKAMGMQILANRGVLAAGQSNPWLNAMLSARKGTYGESPFIGETLKTMHPYDNVPMGAAVNQLGSQLRDLTASPDASMGGPQRSGGVPINKTSAFRPMFADGGAVPNPLDPNAMGTFNAGGFSGAAWDAPSTNGLNPMMAWNSASFMPNNRIRSAGTGYLQGARTLGNLRGGPQGGIAQMLSGMGIRRAHGGSVDSPLGLIRDLLGGQEDKVNANLSGGEYVLDADIVSALGDGNTEAGARKLDQMRMNIRAHKRSAPRGDIPPPAKNPLSYLKGR